jgi:hypothetical protein
VCSQKAFEKRTVPVVYINSFFSEWNSFLSLPELYSIGLIF